MDDDLDQRIHDLESAQSSLEAQISVKDSRIRELESTNSDLKSRLEQTVADLQREKDERVAAQAKVDANVGLLADREAALRTVDELRRQSKKQEDLFDALEKETEELRAKVREVEQDRSGAVHDAEAKAREAATATRRADSLQKQCTDLEQELDERTKALAEYRGQKSEELMQAMSELAAANRRADELKKRSAHSEITADTLKTRLQRAEMDLKTMSDKSSADKAALEKQLTLQETLTNLQKDKAEETTRKVTVLQREMDALKKQLTIERQNTDKERQRATEVKDKAKAVVDELKAKLLEEEANAKKAGAAAEAAVAAAQGQSVGNGADAVPMDLSVDLDSLNDTELKIRMMRLERELEYVRSDRDRNELYLKRILKEVDQKSPLLMSNKKDYQRVLQSHEQLFLKVEDSMRRCQRAEMEREAAATQRDQIEKELETCKTSLSDVKAQVQRLLCGKLERDLGRPIERGSSNGQFRKTASGQAGAIVPQGNIVPQDPEQLIADNLVTFEDIREMQERNIMLVQVVRRMTTELEDTKVTRDMEKEAADDRAVLDELSRQVESLKADRERQAEMLATVTSARDMYRVLLSQETNRDLGSPGGGGPSAATVKAAVEEAEAMKSRVHELERDLGLAREETSKIQQSLRLMGDEVTTAERKESRAVSELAATQRMLSHAEDQVKVLTQDRNSASQALENTTKKFNDLTDNVVRLQDLLQREKNSAYDARDRVKDLSLTITGLKADINIMQASEIQLREENATLRKDARRTNDVVDRLTQIDRNLGAKATAEVSTLREELSRLRRQAEDDRRRAVLADSEKEKVVASSRESCLSMQRELDTIKAEISSLKQTAEAATVAEAAAKERLSQVTARLQEARSRLVTGGVLPGGGASEDDGGVESGESHMSGQLAELGKLQMELQATKAELKAKSEALATNDRQRVQYEAIAKSKQQQLDQLMAAKIKMQEDLEAREKAALAKAAAAEAEVRETKTSLSSTVTGFMKDKDAAEREAKEQRMLVLRVRDQLEASRNSLNQESKIVSQLQKDLEVQRKAVRAADERYRSEIEAHAGAITALRQAEDAQDALKRAKQEAEEARASLAADLMRAKAQWEAKERELKQATEAAEARLSGVTTQNEVLHSHLQTLSQQVEAAQAQRESRDSAAVDKHLEGKGAAATQDAGAASAGAVGSSDRAGAAEDGEKLRLARSVKELTELIRFNRRDMQVVSTNLEMSQQKAAKAEMELERTKRSLREAREEVQKAARESVGAVSKSQHNKLLQEVEQLSTLRESNTMLRSSLRDAEDRTRAAVARVKELELQAAPLQQSERRKSAAAAALESERASLKKEVENWKNRVTSLTASFNAVDPKEHEELKAAYAKLEQSLAETQKAKEALDSQRAEALRAKAAVEKEKNDAVTVKGKMLTAIAELRKMLESAKREAAQQKAAAIRELEAKLAAEKERANKAASETQAMRQEATRARISSTNAHANNVKSLNDQISKAKAEIESLKKQTNPLRSQQDTSMQTEILRKEVAKLQTKLEEVQRENSQNYGMYEKMKEVNRKMKAQLTSANQDVALKDEKMRELQASVDANLRRGAAPSSNPASTTAGGALNTADPSAASAQTAAAAGGAAATSSSDVASTSAQGGSGRSNAITRSPSPTPGTARGLSPARGVAASSAAGVVDDGSEASLRNKLMARTKRPLAGSASQEAAGPSKRVATNSGAAAGGSDSAQGGTGRVTGVVGTTPASQPAATASTTSGGTLSSSSLSTTAGANATTSTFGSTSTASSLNASATPFSGGFGGGTWGGVRRAAPQATGGGTSAPASSSSAVGTGGGFGRMTWGRPAASTPAPAVTGTSTSTVATASSTSTPSTSAVTTTAMSSSIFTSSLAAGGGGGVLSTSAPAVGAGGGSTSVAEDSQPSLQHADKTTGNAMKDEGVVKVADPMEGGAPTVATAGNAAVAGAGTGEIGKDKKDDTAATRPSVGFGAKPLGSSGSLFGFGVGFGSGGAAGDAKDKPTSFAGFGGGGGFGRAVASMKPPNANAAFSTFPVAKLPVPKASTSETSSTGAAISSADTPAAAPAPASAAITPFATSAASPATTKPTTLTTFGDPTAGGATPGATSSEVKFGLSPANAASGGNPMSFGAAVPRFGRPPGATAGATIFSATSSSLSTGSGGGSSSTTTAAGGGDGAMGIGASKTVEADRSAVAAAAAGVPGPGALALDAEARRAARKARFEAPPTAGQPAAGSSETNNTAASTDPDAAAGNASRQTPREDGEIDEDDDGDGDAL